METQNREIKAYLLSGKSLSKLDALHLFNCFNLPGRIYDVKKLLKPDGKKIDKVMVSVISGGKKKKFARYYIVR